MALRLNLAAETARADAAEKLAARYREALEYYRNMFQSWDISERARQALASADFYQGDALVTDNVESVNKGGEER